MSDACAVDLFVMMIAYFMVIEVRVGDCKQWMVKQGRNNTTREQETI
jgi:hypothetical protein